MESMKIILNKFNKTTILLIYKKFESCQPTLVQTSSRHVRSHRYWAKRLQALLLLFLLLRKIWKSPIPWFVRDEHSFRQRSKYPLIGISWRSVAKSGPPKKPMLPYQRIFRSLLCLS